MCNVIWQVFMFLMLYDSEGSACITTEGKFAFCMCATLYGRSACPICAILYGTCIRVFM